MVISGKELSAKLKAEMAAEVATFGAKYGRVPHLVVILVGEDPGSVSYVTGKAKASAEVGLRGRVARHHRRPECRRRRRRNPGAAAPAQAYRRGQGDRRDRQGEGCRRLPSPQCGGFVAETALYAALYAERYPQDAAGCGRGDRRQGGRGDRPQQYRRASRLEIAVGCQCHRDHGAQPYA